MAWGRWELEQLGTLGIGIPGGTPIGEGCLGSGHLGFFMEKGRVKNTLNKVGQIFDDPLSQSPLILIK